MVELVETVSEAEVFVDKIMSDFSKRYPTTKILNGIFCLTSVDYIEIGGGKEIATRLKNMGYLPKNIFWESGRLVMTHPHPFLGLPNIIIRYKDTIDSAYSKALVKIAFLCQSLDETLRRLNCKTPVWGRYNEYIYCLVNVTSLSNVILVERLNPNSCTPLVPNP